MTFTDEDVTAIYALLDAGKTPKQVAFELGFDLREMLVIVRARPAAEPAPEP